MIATARSRLFFPIKTGKGARSKTRQHAGSTVFSVGTFRKERNEIKVPQPESPRCKALSLIAQVPFYWAAQFSSATAGAALVRGILGPEKALGATLPAGSAWQSLLLEFILTFFLMFVIAAVATDTRAVGTMAGIAVSRCLMSVLNLQGLGLK